MLNCLTRSVPARVVEQKSSPNRPHVASVSCLDSSTVRRSTGRLRGARCALSHVKRKWQNYAVLHIGPQWSKKRSLTLHRSTSIKSSSSQKGKHGTTTAQTKV